VLPLLSLGGDVATYSQLVGSFRQHLSLGRFIYDINKSLQEMGGGGDKSVAIDPARVVEVRFRVPVAFGFVVGVVLSLLLSHPFLWCL
jgi:hypothetical protein